MPKWIAVLVLGLCCAWTTAAQEPARRTLVTGWYPWDPYNYADTTHGVRRLTGLDVELTRAALAEVGIQLELVEMDWPQQLAAIESGRLDLGMGTLPWDSRAPGVRYSKPYRRGTDVLFVRRGTAAGIRGRTLAEIVPALRAGRFRLGAAVDYSYGEEVDRLLAEPGPGLSVVRLPNDYDLFRAVESDTIDGFVIDRLTGATVGWRSGMRELVEEHPAAVATHQVRLMFSPKVAPGTIEAFDRGMSQLRRKGAYHRIVRHHTFPLLLKDTVDRPWFSWIDILATCAFALSGVVLASRERYSIFGAFVLGALPAIGGGALRDLIAHRHPLGIVNHPESFLYVAVVVFLGWVANRIRLRYGPAPGEDTVTGRRPFQMVVETFDAMGLATLTVIGVLVALETQCEPLILWGPLLAVITTTGGGIMRNVVRADAGMTVLKGKLYAEIAIAWGLVLSAFFYWEAARVEPREIVVAVVVCTAGAFVTRMLAVTRRWRGPMF